MSDLFDYVSWRGDLSPAAVPYNDVDILVFARLSYIPFDGIVGPGFEESRPLPEAAKQVLAKGVLDEPGKLNAEDRKLLELMQDAPRYAGISLCGFESTLDREAEEQFAALTLRLPLGLCISFRGTDGTLVGWKEDLNMSFSDTVPAQIHAAEYLERAAALPGMIRVCGHSKGGNLAVYASAFCPESIQGRITSVRSFDGPGFQTEVTDRPGFLRILSRARTYVPGSSVVGMMLEHDEPYTVVESRGNGLGQHNVYLWETRRDGFRELQQVTNSSRLVDRTLKDWLTRINPDQRRQVINGIFSALDATQADTVREVGEKRKMAFLKALLEMDEETRRLTLSALRLLYESLRRSLPDWPFKNLEEHFPFLATLVGGRDSDTNDKDAEKQ